MLDHPDSHQHGICDLADRDTDTVQFLVQKSLTSSDGNINSERRDVYEFLM